MFSPPIINDYINQLEALKRDGKENSKESYDIINKLNIELMNCNLNINTFDSLNNSWLLNCIGYYIQYIENDYPKAIEWYIKSSDLGNTIAMNNLGFYYEQIKNYPKAIEWYIKSANLGNTKAMNNLGTYYFNKDYPKAIEWYTKSANIGDSVSMNYLGFYYEQIKDYPKAIEWYIKSSDLGNTMAMNWLASYYREIKKDYLKAIEWYIKSANLGNNNALNYLKNITINLDLYDYIFDLSQKQSDNLEIKEILLNKLPLMFIYNKQQEIINNLKSVKTQGIDKVLINSILKHY